MAGTVLQTPDDNPQVNRIMLQLVIGGTIILFGICVLVNMFTRFIDTDALLKWWPAVLIVVGLALASSSSKQPALGAAIALAGVVIVLGRSGLMTDDLRRIIELIVVLLVGLALITPAIMRKSTK